MSNDPDPDHWRASCDEVSGVCEVPWVLLSAGVDFEVFAQQVEIVCRSGASGFLGGRAIWKESVTMPQPDQVQFLMSTGIQRVTQLREITEQYGKAWTDFFAAPNTDENWFLSYAKRSLMMRGMIVLLISLFVVSSIFAQDATQEATQDAPVIWQPAPGTTWQWQLTELVNASYDVEMYDIDLFDTPQETIDKLHADGRIVICYFSAGTHEDWRSDAGEFPESVLGKGLDEWPGERWLDIRQLDDLQPIMTARLQLAVKKDCDGVEPDNVDAYSNDSGFPLKAKDQLAYNRWMTVAAHELGLSIGLKNDLNQIKDLVDDYDWALNEQCFQYDECELLLPFIDAGKAVFGVEYSEEGLKPSDYCPVANEHGFSWLTKTYDLGDIPPASCLDVKSED